MRSLPAGCRNSQSVSPMPYAIAAPEQTRAKSTAWSLKNSIKEPPYLGAEPRCGSGRRGFLSQWTAGKLRLEPRAPQRRRAEMLLGLRGDPRHDREQQLAQALVVLVEDGHYLHVGDRLSA